MKQSPVMQDMEKTFNIVEMFSSLSGEGMTSGVPASFVRVDGCNLRCEYCDTKYSYSNQYTKKKLKEILERLHDFKNKTVICTGGEPLFERNNARMLPLLISSQGYDVYIETNGAVKLYEDEELQNFDRKKIHYVLDIKTPSSKMEKFDLIEKNADKLTNGDEIKCVVGTEEDIKFCENKIKSVFNQIKDKKINIVFSPIFGKIELNKLAEYVQSLKYFMENSNLTIKLGIQLHKLIWPNIEKGV